MADGRKRAVTVSVELDEELLGRAETLGFDTEATMLKAIAFHLRPKRPMSDVEAAAFVRSANEFYDEHGIIGEDYSPV